MTIDSLTYRFAESSNMIATVCGLVSNYDSVVGPLWVATGPLSRATDTNNLTWTIYHAMQGIMDTVYNSRTLTNYPGLLTGFMFGSSSNFPGICAAPPTNQTYTVAVNASFPVTFGRNTLQWTDPARRPTGRTWARHDGHGHSSAVPGGAGLPGPRLRSFGGYVPTTQRPAVGSLQPLVPDPLH